MQIERTTVQPEPVETLTITLDAADQNALAGELTRLRTCREYTNLLHGGRGYVSLERDYPYMYRILRDLTS